MTDPNHPPPATVLEFTLTLRSVPSEVPVEIRTRRALKCLLRSFGLKLVDYTAKDVPVRPAGKVG